MLKDLLDRAKRVAEEHLPEDVLDAGRKLGRTVAAHAPAPLAEVIHYVTGDEDEPDAGETPEAAKTQTAETTAAEDEPASDSVAAAPPAEAEAEAEAATDSGDDVDPAPASAAEVVAAAVGREDPLAVLQRVKTKAEHGLKPEDRLVVVYATPDQQEDVDAILEILEGVEAEIRHNDLRREPQTARQLATLTGVMVPPYVFINGRHWGSRYDLEALVASGDLEPVLANRLDEIGEEARRIGGVHESFSDEISVDNVLARWKQGHILCVDDLDSWYEVGRDGTGHFYYQGGPRPVEDMADVANEIVRAVEADELEAQWQLEPSVHLP